MKRLLVLLGIAALAHYCALAENALKVQAILPDLAVRRLPAAVFPNFELSRVLANVNWPADLEPFRDA